MSVFRFCPPFQRLLPVRPSFHGRPMLVTKLMRQIAKWQSFASSRTGFR